MTSSVATISGGLLGLAASGGVAAISAALARRPRPYLAGALAERADARRDPLGAALRHGYAAMAVGVRLGPAHLGPARRLRLAGADAVDDRDPARTLHRMVLEPLAARAAARASAARQRARPPFLLLLEPVDADPAEMVGVLDVLLPEYAGLVSHIDRGRLVTGPVTVVLAGRRWPRDVVAAQPDRHLFLEGTFADLGSADAPPMLVPLLAEPLRRCLGGNMYPDAGRMPPESRHLLRAMVRQAHADGRQLRFTGVPTASWRGTASFAVELRAAGVDLVGAHRLAATARVLRRSGVTARHRTVRQRSAAVSQRS
ncbi:MAG TPA: hypothetical protein VK453_20950 [Micromonosporaceae bacterium]|nr:hypothetical protein [Micromonosporaceae bacterium]